MDSEASLRNTLTYMPVELEFGTSGLRGKVSDMTDLECYINTTGFLQYLIASGSLLPGSAVSLAGDLRDSTPRIMEAIAEAIRDNGCSVENLGLVPTPALAFWALQRNQAGIMVTGSHIPSDRNGIKFYKTDGEVLKSDEQGIKAAVSEVRSRLYVGVTAGSKFNNKGMCKVRSELPAETPGAKEAFLKRYTDCYSPALLQGKKVVVYQHSAVGRDMLVELLEALGAKAIPVERSDIFIPIDTENVTIENRAYFRALAEQYDDAFAIVSTDGDSDRPFVVDETGTFHRGDVLGIVVSGSLQADFAAVPISANDAVDKALAERGVTVAHTKIGSPYVITAMQEARAGGAQRVVGWEVNGGFLLGNDMPVGNNLLQALPTRDAFLPIVAALAAATEGNTKVSALFAALPPRFTQAGLIDNFPTEISREIIAAYRQDTPENREALAAIFGAPDGFGAITAIDGTDGVRITFDSGDIAHIRPSGNAPQMRMYAVADSQERADAIVALGIREPDGLLRKLENLVR